MYANSLITIILLVVPVHRERRSKKLNIKFIIEIVGIPINTEQIPDSTNLDRRPPLPDGHPSEEGN
jgi:hypothetical protein